MLNFSELAEWKMPSLFDSINYNKRQTWFFLKEFMKYISEEKTSVNSYKPTQVLTKYFQRKTDLQGIVYNSSKVTDGDRKCYVLFVTNHNCVDEYDGDGIKRNQLVMSDVKQIDFSEIGL